MKTIQIKTYGFDELSDEAKKNAQALLCEHYLADCWYDHLFESWKEKLEKKGYKNPDIRFSGFGPQGDGASFTGKVSLTRFILADEDKRLKKYKKLIENIRLGYIEAKIVRINSRYVHESSVSVEVSADSESLEKYAVLIEKMEKEIDAEVEELSREIYKDLQTEWFEVTSEDYLQDLAEGNDLVFFKDGEIVDKSKTE